MKIKTFLLRNLLILFIIMANFNYKLMGWSNWAGNQICKSEIFFLNSKQEIINFIKKNNKLGGQNNKIRVVGSGHSWSDLICNNNTRLIDIKNLNKILKIDRSKKLVKVQAGITLEKLNQILNKYNMALPNQTAIMTQTLAGTISTATHGTGKVGTFSSFVKEIELVDGNGKVRILNSSDQRAFKSAITSIGSLGVIYSITIDIIDQFYLKESNVIFSKDEFIQKYKDIYKDHDFMQFTWHSQDSIVSVQFFDKVSSQDPNAKISFEALSSYSTGGKRLEEEISVSEETFVKAIKDTENLINNYKIKNAYFIVPDTFCRFVKADNNNLSMASGRDSIFLSISTPVDNRYLDFYKVFENALIKYKGRPHWGKINFLDYNKALKLYGANLTEFIKVKKEFDPNNIFENNYTKTLFNT